MELELGDRHADVDTIRLETTANDEEPGNSAGTDPVSYVPKARGYEISSDEDGDMGDGGMSELRELRNSTGTDPILVPYEISSDEDGDMGEGGVSESPESATDCITIMRSLGVVGFMALNETTAKRRAAVYEDTRKESKDKKRPTRRRPVRKPKSKSVGKTRGKRNADKKRRAPTVAPPQKCLVIDISGETDEDESSMVEPGKRVLPTRECKKKVPGSYAFPDEMYAYFSSDPKPSKKALPKAIQVEEDWLARTVRGIAINSKRNFIFRVQYMKEGETKWVRLSKVWGCINLIAQYMSKDGRKWSYCTHHNLVPNSNEQWISEDRSDGVRCDLLCSLATTGACYVEGEDGEPDDTRDEQKHFLTILDGASEDEDWSTSEVFDTFWTQPVPPPRTNPPESRPTPQDSISIERESTIPITPGSCDSPSRPDPIPPEKSQPGSTIWPKANGPIQTNQHSVVKQETNSEAGSRPSFPFIPFGSNDSASPLTEFGILPNPLFVRPRRLIVLNPGPRPPRPQPNHSLVKPLSQPHNLAHHSKLQYSHSLAGPSVRPNAPLPARAPTHALSGQTRPTPKPLLSIPLDDLEFGHYHRPRPYKPRSVSLFSPNGKRRFKCPDCIYTYESVNSLRNHWRMTHDNNGRR